MRRHSIFFLFFFFVTIILTNDENRKAPMRAEAYETGDESSDKMLAKACKCRFSGSLCHVGGHAINAGR